MKKSVKYKLTFLVFAIIIVIMTIQNTVGHFLAEPYFIAQKHKKMLELYSILKDETDTTILSETVELYEDKENIRILLFDVNDEIIYSSNGIGTKKLQMDEHQFSETPYIIENIQDRTRKRNLLLFGLDKFGKKIIIDTPIASIETTSELLTHFNILIILIVLLPGLMLAYLISKRFVRPIEEICEVTQALAQLDFSNKVCSNKGEDEIHLLAENINTMAEQLEVTIEKLRTANESLQKDIDHQKHIDDMRKQFIADVSHELKSPLALITMYCENIKIDNPLIDRNFYCNAAIDECLSLGELVKNLLEISSLENHLTTLNKENVNFSEYISWILSKNKVIFDQKDLHYHQEIKNDLYVEIDKFYMEQAIKNLLFNAAEYSLHEVSIKLYCEGEWVYFSVYNNCESISSKDLELIWNSFYRIDTARTQSENSHAGLGLHIVKTIITAHEGECTANSQENGLEFIIKIKAFNQR